MQIYMYSVEFSQIFLRICNDDFYVCVICIYKHELGNLYKILLETKSLSSTNI